MEDFTEYDNVYKHDQLRCSPSASDLSKIDQSDLETAPLLISWLLEY